MQQYEDDDLLKPHYFGHVVEERGESPGPEEERPDELAKAGRVERSEAVVPLKRKLDTGANRSPYATPPPASTPPQKPAHTTIQKQVEFLPDWEHHPTGSFTSHGFRMTRSYPTNVKGFRYIPCVPSTKSLNTQDTSGRFDPRYTIYRSTQSVPEDVVRFSWEDRSTYVLINENGTEVTTDKGFRSARVNVPVRQGSYYWEFKVTRGNGDRELIGPSGVKDGAHVRLGVGRRESSLNFPIGVDAYSYGLRDKSGDRVHLATPQPYGKPFGTGDVIGVFLHLPPMRPPNPDDPRDTARIVRRRVPVRFKERLYYECLEYEQEKEYLELDPMIAKLRDKAKPTVTARSTAPGGKPPQLTQKEEPSLRPLLKLEGSKLCFFKNGEPLGIAYENLFDFLPLKPHAKRRRPKDRNEAIQRSRENINDDGSLGYYPFVSVYGGGSVSINPGPTFDFPPPPAIEGCIPRPLSSWYPEYIALQSQLDDLDEEEAEKEMQQAQEEEEFINTKATTAATKKKKGHTRGRKAGPATATVMTEEDSRGSTPIPAVLTPQKAGSALSSKQGTPAPAGSRVDTPVAVDSKLQ